MLRLGESHAKLTVVDDQVGSPTYTRDLSVLLADMIQTERYGVYHATNEGFCSWAELAAEVFRQAGMPVEVTPVPSSAYPTRAVRPKNSRMSKKSLTEAGFCAAAALARRRRPLPHRAREHEGAEGSSGRMSILQRLSFERVHLFEMYTLFILLEYRVHV